jgi:hypothetical protein
LQTVVWSALVAACSEIADRGGIFRTSFKAALAVSTAILMAIDLCLIVLAVFYLWGVVFFSVPLALLGGG